MSVSWGAAVVVVVGAAALAIVVVATASLWSLLQAAPPTANVKTAMMVMRTEEVTQPKVMTC
jgi:hypothetical protein